MSLISDRLPFFLDHRISRKLWKFRSAGGQFRSRIFVNIFLSSNKGSMKEMSLLRGTLFNKKHFYLQIHFLFLASYLKIEVLYTR
jgi:hypothetical protein